MEFKQLIFLKVSSTLETVSYCIFLYCITCSVSLISLLDSVGLWLSSATSTSNFLTDSSAILFRAGDIKTNPFITGFRNAATSCPSRRTFASRAAFPLTFISIITGQSSSLFAQTAETRRCYEVESGLAIATLHLWSWLSASGMSTLPSVDPDQRHTENEVQNVLSVCHELNRTVRR